MSHPARVRELKQNSVSSQEWLFLSHPARVRELKQKYEVDEDIDNFVAPRAGA